VITRTEAAALIPEDVAAGVIDSAVQESAVLTMFRRITVAQSQTRLPIISALPTAYWVNGDTGLKQTSEVNWTNKFLNIEELATIIPIPEAVVDDTSFDVWGEIQPRMAEAAGRLIDAAVFFGSNAPASFPTNVNAAAAAAANNVTEAAAAAAGAFFGDFDAALALVEADGYDPNGVVAARTAKARFRAARATTGEGLDRDRVSGGLDNIDGMAITYPMRGLFPAGGGAGTNVRLFVGDWTQFILGVRRDITYKVLDQAVIQDNTGAIQFNLAQQDMIAMRMVMRVGWQVANPLNYDQPTDASRYPVAVLRY
jgi:HK97 family phage major capsid protein